MSYLSVTLEPSTMNLYFNLVYEDHESCHSTYQALLKKEVADSIALVQYEVLDALFAQCECWKVFGCKIILLYFVGLREQDNIRVCWILLDFCWIITALRYMARCVKVCWTT